MSKIFEKSDFTKLAMSTKFWNKDNNESFILECFMRDYEGVLFAYIKIFENGDFLTQTIRAELKETQIHFEHKGFRAIPYSSIILTEPIGLKNNQDHMIILEEHIETVKEINLIHKAPHYNFGKYEVIKVIEDYHLGFSSGNALKYLARAGKKDATKTIEDLNKARYYLMREHAKPETHKPKDNMDMSPRLIVSDWKLNYNIGSAVIKLLEYNYAIKPSENPRSFSLADAISSIDLEIEYQQGLLDERK